jgi:KUP system potassium uptake protein
LREWFRSTVGAAPEAVLGILSLLFWTITAVVTLKYVLVVMRADNQGEGGIMALTSLALQEVPVNGVREALTFCGLAGAALFYGDGMITPAISVLSAVEGLEIAAPTLKPYIVPLTIGVLVGLFALQRRGSARIGKLFGPVMALWFGVLGIAGIVNVIGSPGVLAALDPRYAIGFLSAHGWASVAALGFVFLAVTGAEALYADMGHFGRRAIRIDWFTFVLPCLLLSYFGQGALALADPTVVKNPFYLSFPGWALYPVVVLATAATIIASQAVISGAFSMSQEATLLGLLPRLEVRQTSDEAVGQVYVPQINWMLAVAVVGLVLGFGSSDALAAAYGIAVSGTMLMTTVLAGVVARRKWEWSWPRTIAILGIFCVIDLAFFAANSLKIPQGGWFPLLVGAAVFLLMSTWRRGRRIVLEHAGEEREALAAFLEKLDPGALPRVPGTAVYLTAQRQAVPSALALNARYNKVLHEHVILLTVVTERVPRVNEERRILAEALPHGFTHLEVRFGFAEKPNVPGALANHSREFPFDLSEVVYFLGREVPVPTVRPDLALWREKLFVFMTRNAVSAPDFFLIPPQQVVELGTRVEL